jgi:hypothetical protein
LFLKIRFLDPYRALYPTPYIELLGRVSHDIYIYIVPIMRAIMINEALRIMRAILIREALGIMRVILIKEVLSLARGRGAFSILT